MGILIGEHIGSAIEMTILVFFEIMRKIKKYLFDKPKSVVKSVVENIEKVEYKVFGETKQLKVENWIDKLITNENYDANKPWGVRGLASVNKIIVHQSLSNVVGKPDTQSIHNYHISPESHLKPGIGAPRIAYHYTIEEDGTVIQCNELKHITWHCVGQNTSSIGVMVVGDFNGADHTGKDVPTKEQLESLDMLLDTLIKQFNLSKDSVRGHCDFGKPACPGAAVMAHISKWRLKS